MSTMSNPADCNCRYTHASDPTCRSTLTSNGAVPESDRLHPADSAVPGTVTDAMVEAAVQTLMIASGDYRADVRAAIKAALAAALDSPTTPTEES